MNKVILLCVVLLWGWINPCYATGTEALTNPGFEVSSAAVEHLPDNWTIFTSSAENMRLSETVARNGSRSVRFSSQERPEQYQGMLQIVQVADVGRCEYMVYVRNDAKTPFGGDAYGQIGIEWIDANGAEIGRSVGVGWDRNLSRIRWTEYRVSADVPEGAFEAKFVIYLFDCGKGGTGCFYVDDAHLALLPASGD